MYALTNATVYTGQVVLPDATVLIEGDRVQAVLTTGGLPADCREIDLRGMAIAPGFIDLQLNGCGGVMFNDAITAATLDTMHQTNLKSGTTSFLPTLITCSDEDMLTAIQVVEEYRRHSPHTILGLHLEGPYLNPKRKGIHNAAFIRPPAAEMLDKIIAAAGSAVRLVTLAPEMVPPEDIARLAQAGILVAGGHTDATFEQAQIGIDAGLRMATHLFNAMSPWQGRSPGFVGAVFQRHEVSAGIIADGFHVHFATLELAYRLMAGRLVLVTDATPPVGTQMDSFIIGGQEVFYRNGKCVSADGTLGGSALTMMEAVANTVYHAAIPLEEALRMASTYPARLLGVAPELGAIAPNSIANLVIFDARLQIHAVIDRGQAISLTDHSPIQP